MLGSVQTAIGTGLAFRTEQANVASLSNVGAMTNPGSHTICNIALATTQWRQPSARAV